MAARRMAQESLDSVLQEKSKRYGDSEAVGEALHLKAQDLLRTGSRARADVYEDIHGDSRYSASGSGVYSLDMGREGLRGDMFVGPSFRSSNQSVGEDSYLRKECGRDLEPAHTDSRDQSFGHRNLGHFPSQDWKLALRGSWEQDLGHSVSQESSWSQEYGFGPSLLGDLASSRRMEKESRDYDLDHPGEVDSVSRSSGQVLTRGRSLNIADQEGTLLGKGDTQGLLGAKGVGKLITLKSMTTKKIPVASRITSKPQGTNQIQKPTPSPDVTIGTSPVLDEIQFAALKIPLGLDLRTLGLPRRKMGFDAIDKADVFSRFGIEIIKWAGFHTIKDDLKFSQLFQTLFELETETCAKMLASFKCSLKPEHRDFCFFTIKFLKHSALKTPRVDNEFLNMLLDKGAVKTKNCFFEIIKPFDKSIMRLQDRLLKGVTPLLMACNAYELSVKMKTLTSPLDLAMALETTNSLCRKSLALLGQTFSLASSFRQEKILEAVGLQDIAPSPAYFPNFEDSTLFGREYIDHLKAWLMASGYPLQLKRAVPPESREQKTTAQTWASSTLSQAVPQRADHRVVDTIDQLVMRVIQGRLSPRERTLLLQDPAYWFLHDQSSSAFKFYREKVLELCPSISFQSTGEAGDSVQSPTAGKEGKGEPQEGHPEQEASLEGTEVLPEEEEEDEEESEDEGGEETSTLRPQAGAAKCPGSEGSSPTDSIPGEGSREDQASTPGLSQASSGSCFPRKRISSKSLKVGMIPAPKRVCLIQESKVHEPVRIAYDRPRGRPIAKKKKPKDMEFSQQKLTDKNVGFQMLQKMGWKEGHGLGSLGKGIREPVSVGALSEGEGLGADGPEQKEDTFDVFRQRMMQMYRHKRASK